jgi:hypothetical protein
MLALNLIGLHWPSLQLKLQQAVRVVVPNARNIKGVVCKTTAAFRESSKSIEIWGDDLIQ